MNKPANEEKKNYLADLVKDKSHDDDFMWVVTELEKAWGALSFYADPKSHMFEYANQEDGYLDLVEEDNGKRAREALDE